MLKEKAKSFIYKIHDEDLSQDGPVDLREFAKKANIKRIKVYHY